MLYSSTQSSDFQLYVETWDAKSIHNWYELELFPFLHFISFAGKENKLIYEEKKFKFKCLKLHSFGQLVKWLSKHLIMP